MDESKLRLANQRADIKNDTISYTTFRTTHTRYIIGMYSEQHIVGVWISGYGKYSRFGLFLSLEIMNTGFIQDVFDQ